MNYYVDNEKEIEINCGSVIDVLNTLCIRYPKMKPQLFDENNLIRRHINIFINDNIINDIEGYNHLISENDILRIVPSISGG